MQIIFGDDDREHLDSSWSKVTAYSSNMNTIIIVERRRQKGPRIAADVELQFGSVEELTFKSHMSACGKEGADPILCWGILPFLVS